MPVFKLKLLGQIEYRLPSGASLSLSTRKSEVLLAYLALAPGIRHPRDRLINLLWSDRGEDQARNSLRQSLSSIKKAFEAEIPDLLQIDRSTVKLTAGQIEVDTHQFEQLIDDSTLETLSKAAGLYQGEFLEGITVRDTACQEWLANERDRLRRLVVEALFGLSQLQIADSQYKATIESAERLVEYDPLQESGWRLLMTAYHQKGDRNHALMAYKRCHQILDKELGVEPEAETNDLQEQIKQDSLGKPANADVVYEQKPEPLEAISVSAIKDQSILVLPFNNLSDDPEQRYFSDGLTEGIIMGLSLFPSLRVHSRHSSFAAGEQALSISEIGQKFDTLYVVEGSVRKTPDQVRISAQLVNTQTGEQIWGKRFDNKLEETFAMEDQVTQSIVAIIKGKIDTSDQEIAYRKPAKDMQSYDLLMRGRFHVARFNPEDNRIGMEMLQKCLQIDPDNARALNDIYRCYVTDWLSGWTEPRTESLDHAGSHISKAIELISDDSTVQASYAEYLAFIGEFDRAETHADRAIKLNPNDTETLATISAVQASLGNVEISLDMADSCRRLDPFHPWVDWVTGIAYYRGRKYQQALNAFKNMPNPSDEIDGWIAACYQRLGDHENASKHLNLYLDVVRRNAARFPGSLDEWQQIWHSTAAYRHEAGIDYPFDALCDAGLKQLVKTPGDNSAPQELHYIAVLPFDNLSGDPAQEYFSDGITESIILNLSLFPGLQVKSRNSSFAFKEQIKNLGEISTELNVDYIVEGSIRKSNDRVRITVQLIEAHNGNQVWGKRYDSIIGDIFDLEEELSRTIAATVTGRVNSDLQRIAITKNATHQQSYDLLLGGMFHCNKFTREDMVIARGKLERCLELDPENVRAHALLHLCHVINWMERWVKDYENSFKLAGEYIRKALKLDPEVGMVQMYYAEYMTFCRDYESANYHIEKALAMNPNDPDSLAFKAFNLNAIGEFESALEISKKCYQLDPYHPWVEWIIAEAQLYCDHPEESIQTILNANTTQSYLRALLVVAYFKIGDEANARLAMQQFQQINRDSMLSMPETRDEWTTYWSDNLPYRDTQMTEDMIEYLMEAGLCDRISDTTDDLPSIAVLPFENMSGDHEQEFFSDGITNDIISTLSRFRSLRVVARHSTLIYKARNTPIAEIAREQDVRYILDGSVRKSGNRVRVNAQLIDSRTGENCWVENYDQNLDDIFAVQDEITKNITVAMQVHLLAGESAREVSIGTNNLKAWESCFVAANLQDSYIRDNVIEARRLAMQALQLDPEYNWAWTVLGWTHWQEANCGWSLSIEDSLREASLAVEKSLTIDHESGEAWVLKGCIYLMNDDPVLAIDACEKAISMSPGNAEVQALMAYVLNYAGQIEKALPYHETSIRLCPICPNWFLMIGGFIYQHFGDINKAIETYQKAVDIEPESPLCRFYLMDSLVEADRLNDATRCAENIRNLDNSFRVSGLILGYSHNKKERKRFQLNLEKMGFSE